MPTFPLDLTPEQLETFRRRAKAAGVSQQKYAKHMILDGKLDSGKLDSGKVVHGNLIETGLPEEKKLLSGKKVTVTVGEETYTATID